MAAAPAPHDSPAGARDGTAAPARARMVLASLILVAAVANLNLAVANVALPSIGDEFDASQTGLDLIAISYSLGLAASVLYLGALGDRYGRKMMLVLGVSLSVPACLLAAYSPGTGMLVLARLLGGLSAGMAYPTTLALITALWAGNRRTHAIALWSGIGAAISSLGPVVSGWLLQESWWGSVFLITLPLAAVALVMAVIFVPSHVNETTGPVDNTGGILSVALVAAVVLAINFAPVPGRGAVTAALAVIALAAVITFVIRQRRARAPLYDLHVAGRRIFWVAATAGIVVFGTLMGAMFVGQQFLQNVLGYSTLAAGASILPAAVLMVVVAPRSARLVNARGSRLTLLTGYVFCLLGFLTMLLLWKQGAAYWEIGLGYAFMGIGVGFAGTPASHSLTGSVPVHRAGMASGTADLQRDLGGAIMQSVLGAVLTAGYAAAFAKTIAAAPNRQQISTSVQNQLEKSFAGAQAIGKRYPQYASKITAAAKSAFLAGDQWAYLTGVAAVVLGAAIVFFLFPKREREEELLAGYHAQDAAAGPSEAGPSEARSSEARSSEVGPGPVGPAGPALPPASE
jgi:MFS transporter, DHA2 family, multidrug resistance protein